MGNYYGISVRFHDDAQRDAEACANAKGCHGMRAHKGLPTKLEEQGSVALSLRYSGMEHGDWHRHGL